MSKVFAYIHNIQLLVVDINECEDNPCPKYSNCVNTDGGYACNCFTGYYKDNNSQCQGKYVHNVTQLKSLPA